MFHCNLIVKLAIILALNVHQYRRLAVHHARQPTIEHTKIMNAHVIFTIMMTDQTNNVKVYLYLYHKHVIISVKRVQQIFKLIVSLVNKTVFAHFLQTLVLVSIDILMMEAVEFV